VIASLPMYDRPETQGAHDALWALIRDGLRTRGIDAPDALDRDTPYDEGWARPDLVLGQICNLPWRARFQNRVTLIGAADHGLGPGLYHSVIVRGGSGDRFALNDPLSNSGWDMPQQWAREAGVALRPVLVTGSHAASLRAVAEGRADMAGIDAVSWSMFQRWDPLAAEVREVARTASTPGMTFVAAGNVGPRAPPRGHRGRHRRPPPGTRRDAGPPGHRRAPARGLRPPPAPGPHPA
jgi:hypothetical protein